jgi:two-component system OmpR family response regulator
VKTIRTWEWCLKNYLELNDYDVTLERDGRLGLAAFQREKYDICLLDVMMPNMDGFTLAEEIRDVDPDIPLFFPKRQDNERRYHPGI